MEKIKSKKSGLLLPIYSLPSKFGIGDLGRQAYDFIDLLKKSGQSLWEILPLNPTSFGNSPYKTDCVFAGNPYFVSLEFLKQDSLLTNQELKTYEQKNDFIDYDFLFKTRLIILKKAFSRWLKQKGNHQKEFQSFKKKNRYWLTDYALFISLKKHFHDKHWNQWPLNIRHRKTSAIKAYTQLLKNEISFQEFIQFKFFEQWKKLLNYCHKNGIQVVGDIPFYVDLDSSDAWVNRQLFQLKKNKSEIRLLSGVPGGDDFSHKDRIWGHPCYNWTKMKQENYQWFLERIKQAGQLYDIVRLDHALGLIRYYGIEKKQNKFSGKWYPGPCEKKYDFIKKIIKISKKQNLIIVVEDLGTATREANKLFREINWNSMRVIQFAATGKYGMNNTHLPHSYSYETIAYTSTHDNDTLQGFIDSKDNKEFDFIRNYLNTSSGKNLRWSLIEAVSSSKSEYVIFPVQDILGLPSQCRHSFGDDFSKSWQWKLNNFNKLKKYQNLLKEMTINNNRFTKGEYHDTK